MRADRSAISATMAGTPASFHGRDALPQPGTSARNRSRDTFFLKTADQSSRTPRRWKLLLPRSTPIMPVFSTAGSRAQARDTDVMDNLNYRKSDAVRKAIKERDTEQRFLPPAVPIPTRSSRCSPSPSTDCGKPRRAAVDARVREGQRRSPGSRHEHAARMQRSAAAWTGVMRRAPAHRMDFRTGRNA